MQLLRQTSFSCSTWIWGLRVLTSSSRTGPCSAWFTQILLVSHPTLAQALMEMSLAQDNGNVRVGTCLYYVYGAGDNANEVAVLLNIAYSTLMDDVLRATYQTDVSPFMPCWG